MIYSKCLIYELSNVSGDPERGLKFDIYSSNERVKDIEVKKSSTERYSAKTHPQVQANISNISISLVIASITSINSKSRNFVQISFESDVHVHANDLN